MVHLWKWLSILESILSLTLEKGLQSSCFSDDVSVKSPCQVFSDGTPRNLKVLTLSTAILLMLMGACPPLYCFLWFSISSLVLLKLSRGCCPGSRISGLSPPRCIPTHDHRWSGQWRCVAANMMIVLELWMATCINREKRSGLSKQDRILHGR